MEPYAEARRAAAEMRSSMGIETFHVSMPMLRDVYRAIGVRIDLRIDLPHDLIGRYVRDDGGPVAEVRAALSKEDRIHTLARLIWEHVGVEEGKADSAEAEVFADELIFPRQNFEAEWDRFPKMATEGLPEHIVRFRKRAGTSLGYQRILERAVALGLAASSPRRVDWRAIERRTFGDPPFKVRPRSRQNPNGV